MHLRAWLLALIISWSHTTTATTDSPSRIAIIIDDIGYNKTLSERAALLPGPFTLSILPLTPHGFSTAQLAHQHSKELMLHTPMSNINELPLGQGGLYSNMSKDNLIAMFRKDLNSLPYIKGMNNHMGSRLTQEPQPMAWIMEEMQSRGLYFVDSRTSAQTIAYDTAQHFHIPSLKRDVFLDDIPETHAITQQLTTALSIAKQHGTAIAIGHPYPSTLAVLENIQSLLTEKHISLVFVSQLLPEQVSIQASPSKVLDFCTAPPLSLWFKPTISIKLKDLVDSIVFDALDAK